MAPVDRAFPLELVLEPEGFIPELPAGVSSEGDRALLAEWKNDRWAALYHLGLQERPAGLSQSALYLYTVAEGFFRALTSLPELEVAREKTVVPLSDEDAVYLLRAVPFAIGSEYIDRPWLEHAFHQLNQVFAREMGRYSGTAALYLAEQSQHLHSPERVFFHLVESMDEEFPFAFLATYATRWYTSWCATGPLRRRSTRCWRPSGSCRNRCSAQAVRSG